MTINLFENHLNTARQNVALTRESLGEALVASQREPNNADLAGTVEQLEKELAGWEQKVKRAEIAASYAGTQQDAETAEARREQQQDAVKNAHELLIREHRSYCDRQIEARRALAAAVGIDGNGQIAKARLHAFCTSLAKAATRGARFPIERASEKIMHIRWDLEAEELPELGHLDESIAKIERSYKKVCAWADRSLAEALAAIGLPAWNDKP
jgi:hypothetical protein